MIAHPADHEPVYEIGWAMTDGTAVATCSVCRHVAYLSSARAALVAEKQGRGGDFVTRDGEPLTTRGQGNDLRVLNVTRGPAVMQINGRLRPAYEWCEMFGHDVPNAQAQCRRCGGLLINEATS